MARVIPVFSNFPRCSAGGTALLFLCVATGLSAQNAIMSLPQETAVAPSQRQPGPPPESRPASPIDTPFKLGDISVRPSLLYRYLNAEGLPVGSRRVASEIQTVAPGLQIDLGQHWTINYAPTWTWYTARALRDTTDQALSIAGAVTADDWKFQFTENYGKASPTLIETAQQTDETTWRTSLGASRSFGSQVGVQLNASLNEHYGDVFPDTRQWSTQDWLTIKVTPQVEARFGPGAGYIDIVGRPDMTFEKYLARLNWKVSDKLDLGLEGGMENRHSRASAGKDLRNPVLDASLDYRPFTTTTLRMAYSRSVDATYFSDQVTKGSSWTIGLEQRLLGRLYLSANWSHAKSTYEAVTVVAPIVVPPEVPTEPAAEPAADPTVGILLLSLPGRADRIDLFNARLTVQFLQRLTFAATFQKSKNDSSQSGFSFTSKQYGFELSCRY